MTNTRRLILAGIIALGLPPMASSAAPVTSGYLVDSAGKLVKNGNNGCWRPGYWTPALAIAECDPDLAKKEEPNTAEGTKPVVAPAPAPVVVPAKPPALIPITPQPETLFGL
ncbi:MAG: hypothetical protein ACLQHK_13935 [Gallionellaceae bacterium]